MRALVGVQVVRVSLACALAGDPEVLTPDEPTVRQDPVLRAELWAGFHERRTLVIVGYALAFGLMAVTQGVLAAGFCSWVLDVQVAGPPALALLSVVARAFLGVTFGLLAAAISRTEFQAIQVFPVLVIPQILLCGLLGPRDAMATWLHDLSGFLPLTYAIEGIEELFVHAEATSVYWRDLGVTTACVVALLALASLTLRRRTP